MLHKRFNKALGVILAASLLLCGCSGNGIELDENSISSILAELSAKEEQTASEDSQDSAPEKTEETAAPETDTAAAEDTTTVTEPQTTEPTSEETASSPNTTETSAEPVTTASIPAATTTAATSATTTSATTTPPTTTAAATTPAAPSGGLSTSWSTPATWQENGKYCGTCELTILNGTENALEGWKVQVTVPKGFEITSSWNGKFSVNGTVLSVDNESYNGNVGKGESASFGFNYASSTEFTPPANITINGTAAQSGNQGNGGNNNNNGNQQTTDTEAPAKPLPEPAVIGLVKEHGKLSVKGTQLVDKNGNNFQLKGMSTHGLSWFPEFVNESAFKTLRDDWNTNAVRLAMYTAEYNGYCAGGSQTELKALIDKGVQAATNLGMYVIIDWHILNDGNPQTNKSEALKFFGEVSEKYKNYDNVIYEICNEPNGNVSWDNDIKPYAEEVIKVIRKNAPDSVVIVGTPTWSQDIDKAAANPLSEKNVLYALHFYASTHTDWLRQRLTDCYNKGLPVFVSEFGCCDASGNGGNDFDQTRKWLELLDSYGISYMNWNLANKNETSSALREGTAADGNWSENSLSESGKWIRKWFRGEQ